MLSNIHVLVVETEFLVALDMQRMLEEAHAATIVFARTIGEAADLASRFPEFDLAIVELPAMRDAAIGLAGALQAAGVRVVASSTDGALRQGVPGLAGVPLLHKPFSDVELLAACAVALAAGDDVLTPEADRWSPA